MISLNNVVFGIATEDIVLSRMFGTREFGLAQQMMIDNELSNTYITTELW